MVLMTGIKNLRYEGKFTEFSEAISEGEDLIKEAIMFSTGTHRGKEYTEDHLQTLANNFSVEDAIPIQLDHSESARDTVGFLEDASVKDGKLMGKVRIIEEDAKSRIFKKLLNKISVSFYTDKEGNPTRLREVSLVAFPQLKGAKLFSENGFTSESDELVQTKEVQPMPEETNVDKFAELEAAYAEKFATLEGKLNKFAEEKVATKVEKFQELNKVVPAQKDSLTRLLASFNEEQAEAFEEFMFNMGKVEFSEVAEVEASEKPEEKPEHEDFRESEEYKNYVASL
ncbi:prohead core protein protease [Bacillus phage 1_ICo-2020]|uniref:Prohead core protein protease n=1 Tax=Bacillus phage 1_ICo-2020 TaxID=2759272 RepID=A0A7G8AKB8_9CAUD|nr:prohead core protein protease [Bacillus phage 1_ICo-2020]